MCHGFIEMVTVGVTERFEEGEELVGSVLVPALSIINIFSNLSRHPAEGSVSPWMPQWIPKEFLSCAGIIVTGCCVLLLFSTWQLHTGLLTEEAAESDVEWQRVKLSVNINKLNLLGKEIGKLNMDFNQCQNDCSTVELKNERIFG